MSGLANYRILGPLGSGTFGQVKLAEHLATSTKVALKILKKRTISEKRIVSKVKREIKVLKLFHHPHIIRLYEVIDTPSSLVLVLEYLPGGELYNYLDRHGKLSEDQTRLYVQQILGGLEYIHCYRLAHRDIKPENLLLDQFGDVKLADFGLSNVMPDGDFLKTSCGSPNYAAPEILAGLKYCGPEVDIWSTGVVLYTLLAGFLPFDDSNLPSLFAKIRAASFVMPYHFSDSVKDLIIRMLNPDPIARITACQIRNHPWFQINIPVQIRSRNSFIDIELSSRNVIQIPIDEALFQECLNSVDHDVNKIDEIRNGILKKIDSEFTVCYYLLLDKKLTLKKSQTQEIVKAPLFKHYSIGSTASTRSSSRNDFSESTRVEFEPPCNWVYGFRSNLDVNHFMINIFNSFKDSSLEWKIITNLSLELRSTDPRKKLKMRLNIYKYDESFVLDFKLAKGSAMIFLEVLQEVYYFLYLRTCF